jgi:hypothetical protein
MHVDFKNFNNATLLKKGHQIPIKRHRQQKGSEFKILLIASVSLEFSNFLEKL